VLFYAGFLVVMAFVGLAVAKVFRLDTPAGRAIVFTGATRNSLVVLPLALALPVNPVVVVTQTLVEVIGMVIYVRVVPRLLP
jgi:ACR3 family arsenite efflux pump ArsB